LVAAISNRGINEGENRENPWYGFVSTQRDLSHTSILYYYSNISILYVKEILEKWGQIVSKSQNTKLIIQSNKYR
jgi:hypothetical protein